MRELCLILIYIATVYAFLFVLMPTTVSILFFLNRFLFSSNFFCRIAPVCCCLQNQKVMSRKENLISELHTIKGTWKIDVRITDLWQARKQNSKQTIEMVLMDQTGSKIGVTLWQELFTELRDKLQCGSSYLIQNLRIVDNQSEYRVSPAPYLVYFLKTTSVKEIHRPEIPSNVYLITPFTDIISGLAPRHTLVDIVGVIADLIDVKTVNPPHRMIVRLRDNSNCDILITVWEDYAIQLHDAIDRNLLLQEPLVVMLTLGKIKDAIDKYPLRVRNIKFGSKLYVNANITEIHEFRQSQSNVVEKFLQNAQVVSIVDEIIIDAPWSYDSCPNCTTTFDPSKGGSAFRSCHTSVVDTVPWDKLNVRMEHNGDKGNFLLWDATCIKLFGKTVGECRDELIAAGDDIKVFPACADEILLKTWAVRFKFRSQLRQSSMLDVSEELHHIQSLIATLGLKEQSSKGKGIAVEPKSSPPIFVPTRRKTILQEQKRQHSAINDNLQCISQCSPTINHNNNPATSFQSTPPSHETLSIDDSERCSKRHAINVSSIQRNLMSSYDNQKNITTASTSTFQASNAYSNITQLDIHRDEHQRPTDTTQHDQFVGYDSSDFNDDDVNMTQENIDIEYSLNDPTIDDFDDYDEQTFLSASSTYQNTGGTYIDIGDPVWECPHCKAMMWYDERINKDKQTNKPRFSLCCSDGKIQLPLLHEPPHPLNHLLFNNQDPKAKNFQQYIRIYNLMFAFTSPGIKFDKSYTTGKGPPTFRIHGQTHHLIGSLLPMPNNPPKFAQLYIYDTDNEVINRLSQNPMHDMLDEQIIIAIKDMLDHHNHYAQKFRMARDKLHSAAVPDLKMKLISQRQTDGRLYNLPTTTEVAALIVGDEHSAYKRDIIIEKQSGLLKRIHELHPAYLPLQYPLLYPKGEDGYRLNIPHKDHANIDAAKRKQVTLREYFAYRLQSRTDEAQTILHSRRLFQQWIVDGYCMIESQKLNYVRQHQQQLRVDKYINLTGSNDHPETLGRDIGKRIILPSSFVGGQRYMEQLYFDGMAICGHLGFPDLFLTMTCNPTWPEIQCKVTQSNLTPNNCPDIITRVFKIKLNQLMNDLKHGNIFGNIIGCIRLTEKETIHLCLTEIENMLQANRRSLRDFLSIPYPIGYARNQHHNNLIHNEMAYDKEMLAKQYNTAYQLLTDEQKTIVDTIMSVVNTQSAAIYFLYGYGGTGKTFVWTTLSSGIRSNGGIVCTISSSGIASLLLPVGQTAHSKFAIPVPATKNLTCNIHQGRELAELLKGQSLHHIGLYLPHPVFSHGQLYVALSRVKSKDELHILIHDNDGNPKNITTNVVYNELLLQVPFTYHRQWLRNYPKYVLFHYDGEIHFIRVRTLGTKCFFANGLNDFRRAHNLHESVILRLVASDKNTTFTVHIDRLAHHHSSPKPIIYRRRYIFTVDITDDMLQQNLPLQLPNLCMAPKKSITIHHGLSKSTKWPLTIHQDIPAITQPWFNLIHEKNLRPEDEVVFYYRFHDHAWELLIRKAIKWNNSNTDLDFDD
ncbi:Replication protein A DNA-binding subunit A [Glycine soja]